MNNKELAIRNSTKIWVCSLLTAIYLELAKSDASLKVLILGIILFGYDYTRDK